MGMFEGNEDEGEMEIGQISGMIHEIKPAAIIVKEIIDDYLKLKNEFLQSSDQF